MVLKLFSYKSKLNNVMNNRNINLFVINKRIIHTDIIFYYKVTTHVIIIQSLDSITIGS